MKPVFCVRWMWVTSDDWTRMTFIDRATRPMEHTCSLIGHRKMMTYSRRQSGRHIDSLINRLKASVHKLKFFFSLSIKHDKTYLLVVLTWVILFMHMKLVCCASYINKVTPFSCIRKNVCIIIEAQQGLFVLTLSIGFPLFSWNKLFNPISLTSHDH